MRDNIKKLINSGISAHTVAKETGLPRNTVYRIFTGEASLDNIRLENAEVLNDYYLKEVKLVKKLETARQDYNNWEGKAVIFVDFDTNDAWTIVEEDINYHSKSVIAIIGKDDLYGRKDRIGKERLEKLVKVKREKFEEGWDRLELEDNHFAVFANIIGS